jgi:DNA-binding transcriptional MocR family regulator
LEQLPPLLGDNEKIIDAFYNINVYIDTMTIWAPDLESRAGPRYQAIAEAIADAVELGDLSPGDKLPPQRDLAWKLGVTVGTISRAYTLAEQRGLVTGEVGRGTFVQQPRQTSSALVPPTSAMKYDMGINIAPTAAQAKALTATMSNLAETVDASRLVPYMPSAGYLEYREAVAVWISRAGIEADPDRIILACGAQHALSVVLSGLTEPGDHILTEALTYPGVIDMCRLHHLQLEPVAIDSEGMLPDALERAVRHHHARFVAINPTLHNPTTATMSLERRQAIVDVARAHDLTILEDDVYGWMKENRPPAIAALAPERTVFVSSASKSFAPGLRAGWIFAPEHLMHPLMSAAYATSVCQPPLMHEIATAWINNGTADRLVLDLREEVARRQAMARAQLDGLRIDSDPAGFHILLHLPPPWRSAEFAEAALAAGIRVVPASTFAVGQTAAPHAVRASVTSIVDRSVFAEGLAGLRDIAFTRHQLRGVV